MDSQATDETEPLVQLLQALKAQRYGFVAPTPRTARLVRRRKACARAGNLRDIFGWGLPFQAGDLPATLMERLRACHGVSETREGLCSTVRVVSLEDDLVVHSALRIRREHAVFFGPDTYRFARLIRQTLKASPDFRTAVDVGTGAGAGALVLGRLNPDASITASDPNPRALHFAAGNARAAGIAIELVEAAGLPKSPVAPDLVVANPPYIAGDSGALYKDGGDQLGAELSLDWVGETLPRLAPGGRMILYSGATIVEGRDILRDGLERLAKTHGCALTYEEIDPDVFGETLAHGAYAATGAERIAAVGAVLTRL